MAVPVMRVIFVSVPEHERVIEKCLIFLTEKSYVNNGCFEISACDEGKSHR